jgi:hypothetical protein
LRAIIIIIIIIIIVVKLDSFVADEQSDGGAKNRNNVWGNMKEAEFDTKEFQK